MFLDFREPGGLERVRMLVISRLMDVLTGHVYTWLVFESKK
jgi:hypothetical protein